MPDHRADLLILGGGMAGIAAAMACIETGQRPLVLESAPELGGRARSFHARPLNEIIDNGPHLLIGAYDHTLRLLRRLGTADGLWHTEHVTIPFWDDQRGYHALSCPAWPAPLHLLAGLWRLPDLTGADRRAALRLGTALVWPSRAHETWEAMSVTQWLERLHQTPALCKRLWYPLCLAALNEPAGSANAALFATVLRRAFFSHRQAARLLIPRHPLGELLGKPAQRYIMAHGGEVRCRCRVLTMERQHGRITHVHTNQGTIPVTQPVISALPFTALARLIPEAMPTTDGAPLAWSPIVSVYLRFDAPVVLPAPLIGLPQRMSQWLFDRNRLQNPAAVDEPGRLAAVISGAYREIHWPAERLIEQVRQDVEHILRTSGQEPGRLPANKATQRHTAADRCISCHSDDTVGQRVDQTLEHEERRFPALAAAQVIKESRATLAAWPGGSISRPGARTAWDNLFLAGDWTRTGLPATLEGAAQSGREAAHMALLT